MRTNTQLHDDVVALLAPITRDRYDYAGPTVKKIAVNPTGIDLHDGKVGQAAMNPAPPVGDGTVAHYMELVVHPRTDRHTRASGGASQGTFGFSLTVASGTRAGALFAIDKVLTVTSRARLHASTGLLVAYFDQIQLIEDPDAPPARWYAPLRWSTTVH